MWWLGWRASDRPLGPRRPGLAHRTRGTFEVGAQIPNPIPGVLVHADWRARRASRLPRLQLGVPVRQQRAKREIEHGDSEISKIVLPVGLGFGDVGAVTAQDLPRLTEDCV